MLASDLMERLLDFAGTEGAAESEGAVRKCRRAIQDALREFPGLHRWRYHLTWHRLMLVAQYNTGTVEYDADTRELTLSDGVWPSWAASGDVRIGEVVARVSSRNSDTELTLDPTITFQDDIAAGATYTIYQDQYLLPADYLANDRAIAEEMWGPLDYILPQHHLWRTRWSEEAGNPRGYTIVPGRTVGRFAMMVTPQPDQDMTLDFYYQRRMRRILYDNVGDETAAGAQRVSVTSASATVNGVNTAWTSSMAGATIRISADGNKPTGADGSNLAAIEAVVLSVQSATELTLTANAGQTLSNVAYQLSDPLDLDEGSMANAFIWTAIRALANTMRFKDRPNVEPQWRDAVVRAREDDSRDFSAKQAGPRRGWRPSLSDMPTGPDDV